SGWLIFLFGASLALAAEPGPASTDKTKVILIVGAAGEKEFGTDFSEQATEWAKACIQAGAQCTTIGIAPPESSNLSDLESLKQTLAAEPKAGIGELWVVLIGHGTFDGKEAKFNLRGPDLDTTDLAAWLQPFTRPLAVIDTASASAPFIAKLS